MLVPSDRLAAAIRGAAVDLLGAATAVGILGAPVSAQLAQPTATGGPVAQLEVLRARADVEQAAIELARADALLQRSMLSPSEHESRRAVYVRARITYLGAVLTASGARAHVAIARAVKSRAADGRLRVVLTLRNETAPMRVVDSAHAGSALAVSTTTTTGWSGFDSRELAAWTTVHGAVVTLKTEVGPGGAVVSRPYERALGTLARGESREVAFELLEDLADVVVALDVDGRTEERRIRLESAAAASVIAVHPTQFSLEGDLGTQLVYELRLQRGQPSAVPTRLLVRGLPPEVAVEFRDPDTRTRLGQLRFPDGATTARVQLAVSLPGRPSSAVRPDAPLAFAVVAADEVGADGGASGEAHLELVPRGIARLELRPATLALQATTATPTTLSLLVRNAGSGRLDDVRLRAEAPPRWQVTFDPATVAALGPGDEQRVSLRLQPPADADGGDYELRVGVDDASAARRIEVEDKLLRVRVAGSGGLTGPFAGVVALAALSIGALVYGRRWVTR